MPLNPGNQTLTFNPPGNFEVDRLHSVPASEGLVSFDQRGCMVQPITVKDKVENTAYSDATEKIFTPYNTYTAAVKAEWRIIYRGHSYRILGDRNTPDAQGRVFQCMFIVKKEDG